MEILKLDSVESTNSWVAENEGKLSDIALVYCREQLAGRGQRGNSWESQPGCNVTASLIFHPKDFPASRQFEISEAVAQAIVMFFKAQGVKAQIKWPNDIYVGDKKICGILVEHVVLGKNISRTIAGFGININQTEFHSDAPNPVSLKQLTSRHFDIEECVALLATLMGENLNRLENGEDFHDEFHKLLWRHDGIFYRFHDHKRNCGMEGRIKGVGEDGILSIEDREGTIRTYSFKEIEFLL